MRQPINQNNPLSFFLSLSLIFKHYSLNLLFIFIVLKDLHPYEMGRFDRYKSNFSAIIFDVDFFKKVNDTYGHLTGDEVLIYQADILKKNARETDVVSRWGGEEF